MFNLQIVSDLHIEYKNDSIPDPLELITPSANILVMAGDIGSIYKYTQLQGFMEKLCTYFQLVLYIPGNHEYYTMDNHRSLNMGILKNKLYSLEKNIDNLYILDKSSVLINNVCIVGCTLWSDLNIPLPRFIVRIHDINATKYKNMHDEDVNYIEKMIKYCEENNYKLVIVTHHGPTYKVLEGAKKRSKFLSLYTSHLDELLNKKKVNTWICGHIHKNFDFMSKKGTRILGNQKGKPKDKIHDYNKKCIISV